MRSIILRWLGITLLLETGLIHYYTAQSQYEKAGYLGYVFVAFAAATLLAALGIHRGQIWGWRLGLFLALTSCTSFFLSRMVRLPDLPIDDWLAPLYIVAAATEFTFVLVCWLRPWRVQAAAVAPSTDTRLRYILPVTSLCIMALGSTVAYRWDVAVSQEYGHHVGSVDQVCSTPLTSFTQFEQQYGLRVSLVEISMLDSIVDVRLKVMDVDKANTLLKNQAALLVDQQVLVLAPHQHRHGGVKQDKIHFLFFPTQNKTIQSGSEVSLVFGPVRLEPVTLK